MKQPARSGWRFVIPLVCIPTLVILGLTVLDGSYYLIVSIGVALLSLVLFYLGFEQRDTTSRRTVLVAVLTALATVSRFIPLCKPVTALTILAALYLGAESGFLVGSMAALLSNIYFGQGPWTPFQMLSWGLIGLLAGLCARPLRRHPVLLILYGALSGVVFSLLMDVYTVLWYGGGFDPSLYGAAILTALPHTVLYAASNALFLAWLHKPIGQKLERIKKKYGI